MLYLVSSSAMRINLLKNAKITFLQISPLYDESVVSKDLEPEIYVQRVLLAKEAQFYAALKSQKGARLQNSGADKDLFQGFDAHFKTGFDARKDSVLFADSVVSVPGFRADRVQNRAVNKVVNSLVNKALGKARDENEARAMLEAQSGGRACIYSAFLLNAPKFRLISLSKTELKFKEFDKEKMRVYIETKGFLNKAGAIACEGFHKEFILEMKGSLNTALGLDTSTLKAYL